jgi:hypothetical protein
MENPLGMSAHMMGESLAGIEQSMRDSVTECIERSPNDLTLQDMQALHTFFGYIQLARAALCQFHSSDTEYSLETRRQALKELETRLAR